MSVSGLGDIILSAQKSTLIGAETGFALQHEILTDVAFGSNCDMVASLRHFPK
jgi:hypothetical protein